MSDLEPLNPEYVQSVLSKPPFVTIPGVHNARDLGSYSAEAHHLIPAYTNRNGCANGNENAHAHGGLKSSSNFVTRPGYMFRSAEVSRITEEGAYSIPLLPRSVY